MTWARALRPIPDVIASESSLIIPGVARDDVAPRISSVLLSYGSSRSNFFSVGHGRATSCIRIVKVLTGMPFSRASRT